MHQAQHLRQQRGLAEAGNCCIGRRQQQIPGADRNIVAKVFPYRVAAAPGRVAILQVVMDQRSVVQQFASSRDGDGVLGSHAKAARNVQRKARPDAPAAGLEVMTGGCRRAVRQADG